MNTCILCKTSNRQLFFEWLYRCNSCGLESSQLQQPEFNGTQLIGWDDSSEIFLNKLRLQNSKLIFNALHKFKSLKDSELLDIGCGAGWFLKIANGHQIKAIGIEVDIEIATSAKHTGLEVISGHFPESLPDGVKFDVISFNDVVEHLENPHEILSICRSLLNEKGILIINLPNSNGFFYFISKILAKIGYQNSIDRLWQKGYESPHLFYFNNRNLKILAEQHSFKLIHKGTLPSISLDGLWERINKGKDPNIFLNIILYAGIIILYPLIKHVFPSDIIYHFYRPI